MCRIFIEMIKLGIIGKPNAGKSTFFNFLTHSEVQTGDYPFTTIDPNKAIFKLHSVELNDIANAIQFPDVQQPEIEVWDIAGLIVGSHEGAGLGNEFLGHILSCDILIHLIRDSDHIESDRLEIENEIALFDHSNLLKPYERGRRMARLYPKDMYWVEKEKIITKAYKKTATGKNISEILTGKEHELLQDIALISDKPRFHIYNTDTNQEKSRNYINALELNALATLSVDELSILGLGRDVIDRALIDISDMIIEVLQLKRFFTVGHLGIKMYVIHKDATISKCAELLHSEKDDEIRGAYTADYCDLIKYKTWKEIISNGLAKRVGTQYIPEADMVIHYI